MTSVQRENDWPWHLAFGALLAVTVVTFGLWATGYVGQSAHYAVLAVTITFVLFMAFNIGGNDVANSFAAILDVLSTGEINAKAAVPGELMLAAGLWFIGPKVIMTVGSGLMKMHPASGFAAELSEVGVVMIASLLGLPVSSTHILIGAILGVGIINKAANWSLMKPIALAWVITVPAAALVGSVGVLALQAVFG